METLREKDSVIANLVDQERERQKRYIELIASENFTSKAVLEVTGSILTNKYAEGYPGARYYGGCEIVDQIETLAQERLKSLFNVEYANVQPHSGSQANMAVYLSVLQAGDTIMGMSLSHGGHLTHGASVSFSGKIYQSVTYGVSPETEQIDYEEVRLIAHQHKPKIIVAGASSYSRFIDFSKFYQISQEIGAYLMCDIAHIAGPISAGLHPTPVGYSDFITSTTHKTLRGPRGGIIMISKDSLNKEGIKNPKGEIKKMSEVINSSIIPGIQGGPLLHVIAGKAVAFREAFEQSFKDYQKQVLTNAKIMSQTFQDLGYRIVSGGTDNHMFCIDLRSKKMTGKEVEDKLNSVGITLNKNSIPFDETSPFITSGVRIGTPAMTTRGMKEKDVTKVTHFIHEVLETTNSHKLKSLKEKIHNWMENFPLPY